MEMKVSPFLVPLVAFAAMTASASVKLGAPFADGAVLQRGVPIVVWGTADAGEKVKVTFAGQVRETVAAKDGAWRVTLEPLAVSAEGRVLSAGNAQAKDVLVGEVWLASGQSNMDMPLWSDRGVDEHGWQEMNGALDDAVTEEPLVRIAHVPWVWSAQPVALKKPLVWRAPSAGKNKDLPAIAFHYALTLHRKLKVPVGVIVSAWGGTAIQPWISEYGYTSGDDGNYEVKDTLKYPRVNNGSPTTLWNGMIHPLLPLAVKGVLWYQGESNVWMGLGYRACMSALYRSFQQGLGQLALPFYFVQIAPFHYWADLETPSRHDCDLWEAQARFARETPKVGMVSTVDISEPDNIHPGDKRTVALRLAALALNRDYGCAEVPCESAALATVSVTNNGFRLTFDHAGLWKLNGRDPAPFEMMGPDGVWWPAVATYRPGEVFIRSSKGAAPMAFRYCWDRVGRGRLKNDAGLPLAPIAPLGEAVAVKKSAEYSVKVNGKEVTAFVVPAPENRIVPEERQPYSCATFVADGEVTVEVTSPVHAMDRAQVLPASKGVKFVTANVKGVTFNMKPGETLVLEPCGRHHALVLSANAPVKDAPKAGGKGVVCFGPGYQRVGVVEVGSDTTVYFAPGAWVEGGLKICGTNVTVCGNGVLSAAHLSWTKGPNLICASGKNIVIRDVSLFSPCNWTLVLNRAENATVEQVKILGGRVINDDGIDICRSRDVTIRNCFVRCQDDCIAPKWWCENLVVTNCTLWTDIANAVRVGYECSSPEESPVGFRNLKFLDLDILHLTLTKHASPSFYWCDCALVVQASNRLRAKDLLFERIRFHETNPWDTLLAAKNMRVNIGYDFPDCGDIDGLVLRDIHFDQQPATMQLWLENQDDRHTLKNVRLENVTGHGPVSYHGKVEKASECMR